jgi:hypothetical protein
MDQRDYQGYIGSLRSHLALTVIITVTQTQPSTPMAFDVDSNSNL